MGPTHNLKITTNKGMRCDVDFALTDNETGKKLGGIQSCKLEFNASMRSPVVTISFIPNDVDIDLKEYVMMDKDIAEAKHES